MLPGTGGANVRKPARYAGKDCGPLQSEARDPKLRAVLHFLTEQRTEGKTWLEHGCIVFSQYYDTALWGRLGTR